MNTLIKAIVLTGCLFTAQAACAAKWYIDGGLGSSSLETDVEGVGKLDGDDTYLRIAVGAELSKALSIEGGYWDLGEAADTISVAMPPFGTFDFDVTSSAEGLFGDVKGDMQLNSDTVLFGKVGLFMWDAEVCSSGACADDDGNDLFFGGGVGFDMGPGALNLELLLLSLDDADVTTLGLSYSLPFGK